MHGIIFRIGIDNTAAYKHDRALRSIDCRHCGSYLFFFRQLFHQRFQLARLIIKQSGLHITRHIYQHRAGTACFRQLEGQPDRLR